MTKLGITRSAAELAELMDTATHEDITIIPLPLTDTIPLDFALPANNFIQTLDWLFFTSARGVRIFLRRLEESDMTLADKTKIAALGEKTSLALGQFGLSAAFIPQEISSEGLFGEFLRAHENIDAETLYICAKEPRFNPKQLFDSASIRLSTLAVYETIPAGSAPAAAAEFGADDYILFTAPSAAAAYQRFFGSPIANPIALGKTTAQKISEQGWRTPIIMDKPDISAVLAYLEEPQQKGRGV